jgi:hypothetical protein
MSVEANFCPECGQKTVTPSQATENLDTEKMQLLQLQQQN